MVLCGASVYLRVEIPNPDGSIRPLGIPTVLDRLIQQAIEVYAYLPQVLSPIFDSEFSESSCGFLLGRSTHDGVRRVKQFIRQGRKIAVDNNLAKFFDRVNHDILMSRIADRIKDKRVLCLSANTSGLESYGQRPPAGNGTESGPEQAALAIVCLHSPRRPGQRTGKAWS